MPYTTRDPHTHRFVADVEYKSEGLRLLINALGGATALARRIGRDPALVRRWRLGSMPIPSEVALVLMDRAQQIISALQAEIWRLKSQEIPQFDNRREQRIRRARQRFYEQWGRWPTKEPIRPRKPLQVLRWW